MREWVTWALAGLGALGLFLLVLFTGAPMPPVRQVTVRRDGEGREREGVEAALRRAEAELEAAVKVEVPDERAEALVAAGKQREARRTGYSPDPSRAPRHPVPPPSGSKVVSR